MQGTFEPLSIDLHFKGITLLPLGPHVTNEGTDYGICSIQVDHAVVIGELPIQQTNVGDVFMTPHRFLFTPCEITNIGKIVACPELCCRLVNRPQSLA